MVSLLVGALAITASDPSALTFGTGHAGIGLATSEATVFEHSVLPGHVGVMTHFWSTCTPAAEAGLLVRYYVDNETTASIAFNPPLASGVGFDDTSRAPWGTKWFGLGAGKGDNGQAWFHNIRVPFRSIRVTVQSSVALPSGFYIILRGGLDLPITIGDTALPVDARLALQTFEGPLTPLQTLDVVHVPKGRQGQVFMSTLSVTSNGGRGGLNL